MLSYSNRYKRLNYSLGFNRSKDRLNQQPYNIYYARISMPLDWKKNNLYLSSQLQHSDYAPHSTNANINLSGSLTQDNKINFGVGLSQNQFNQQQNTAINAHVNYLHPVINIGASLNHDRQQTQYSLSAQGAIVAHSLGLTATNTIPNTYTIVHVDQGQYAGISNAWGIRLDRFGNAIYSNSSPYNKNLIQIDPDQMPITSTLQSNQATVIPRLYSATMVNFSAQQSTIYVLRITSPHGQLPMGTEVRNLDQQLLGRLAQSNQVILNRYNPQSDHVLSLIWGSQRQNSCQIQLPVLNNKKQQSFQIISVECK
ncbi:pili synthesis usher PapC-like protein [Acinetobacter calcoaceticus]|uniref:Pili synthesis usher PapC-like protein n=1 Tax=Acinetobacter calcoaceticus TaxID=471 RepID=A0A4R1XK85_ACICA|nr:pili synthesis usher PapC-like protein [Acinetobacter calcoaceticus]